MRKSLVMFCLLITIAMGTLCARPLTNLFIEAEGQYTAPSGENYFKSMGTASNWKLGGGLSFRLWILEIGTSALADTSYSNTDTLLGVRPSIGLSLPVSSVTDLEMSVGPNINLLVPKQGNSNSSFGYLVDGNAVDSASFGTLMSESYLSWKIGLALKLGNFGLHIAFMCPTKVSFSTIGQSSLGDYFQTGESALSLAASFDMY